MGAVIYLLSANAVLHVISFIVLNNRKDPSRFGVIAFAFINVTIALFLLQNLSWANWLALIFPAIGFTGLFLTIKSSKSPRIVDYSILAIDTAIIILMVNKLFF